MTASDCRRVSFDVLVDYAAGELPAEDAAALEDHLFTCDACASLAADLERLLRAVPGAVRAEGLSGFVTDAVLNRLARDGVRVRSFTLSPGAVVPCAVWDEDEVMVLRLRGDVSGATEFTMSQRVAGTEVVRRTAELAASPQGELIFALPADMVRQLPATEVDVLVTARVGEDTRTVGRYTLVHEGSLRR